MVLCFAIVPHKVLEVFTRAGSHLKAQHKERIIPKFMWLLMVLEKLLMKEKKRQREYRESASKMEITILSHSHGNILTFAIFFWLETAKSFILKGRGLCKTVATRR